MDGCESWTIKKAEHQRIDAFELWCCRRLLRVPWTARRSNHSILKEITPEYSLEGLMLKLKLQYFGHWCEGPTVWKDPDAGKDWRQEEKGVTEGEMIGWHHWLSGHEFEQTVGDTGGQGSLVHSSPWGHRELDTTENSKCQLLLPVETKWNHGNACAGKYVVLKQKVNVHNWPIRFKLHTYFFGLVFVFRFVW